jgi:hypothetical protein
LYIEGFKLHGESIAHERGEIAPAFDEGENDENG